MPKRVIVPRPKYSDPVTEFLVKNAGQGFRVRAASHEETATLEELMLRDIDSIDGEDNYVVRRAGDGFLLDRIDIKPTPVVEALAAVTEERNASGLTVVGQVVDMFIENKLRVGANPLACFYLRERVGEYGADLSGVSQLDLDDFRRIFSASCLSCMGAIPVGVKSTPGYEGAMHFHFHQSRLPTEQGDVQSAGLIPPVFVASYEWNSNSTMLIRLDGENIQEAGLIQNTPEFREKTRDYLENCDVALTDMSGSMAAIEVTWPAGLSSVKLLNPKSMKFASHFLKDAPEKTTVPVDLAEYGGGFLLAINKYGVATPAPIPILRGKS